MNHLEVTAILTEMENRMDYYDSKCSVCCSPVKHHCADEGTQSYEAADFKTDIKRLILAMREGLAGISASDAMTGKKRLVRVYESLKGLR